MLLTFLLSLNIGMVPNEPLRTLYFQTDNNITVLVADIS